MIKKLTTLALLAAMTQISVPEAGARDVGDRIRDRQQKKIEYRTETEVDQATDNMLESFFSKIRCIFPGSNCPPKQDQQAAAR